MPINQNYDHLKRANDHIKLLKNMFNNIESYEIDLTNIFNEFKQLFDKENNHALANSRSTIPFSNLIKRASRLYFPVLSVQILSIFFKSNESKNLVAVLLSKKFFSRDITIAAYNL